MKITKVLLSLCKELCKRFQRHADPVGYARKTGVKIGQGCRLIDVSFGSEPYLVTIGDHVSATATSFITHDGGIWVFREANPEIDLFGPIKVGNNVFLGYGVIVMPGVTIGSNVVVGAGSVVTKDIPSDTVVAGVPARLIKSTKEYYEKCMNKFDYTHKMIPEKKREYLYKKFGL